jgi:hypothetical protein
MCMALAGKGSVLGLGFTYNTKIDRSYFSANTCLVIIMHRCLCAVSPCVGKLDAHATTKHRSYNDALVTVLL